MKSIQSKLTFRYLYWLSFFLFITIACSKENSEIDRSDITTVIVDKWWVSDQGQYIRKIKINSDKTIFFNTTSPFNPALYDNRAGIWHWDNNGVFKVENATGAYSSENFYLEFSEVTNTSIYIRYSESILFLDEKHLYQPE